MLDCADPKTLEGLHWLACYLSTGKHMAFYWSFITVLSLLAITAPLALVMGLLGALAKRTPVAPVRWLGQLYISMVRGVPDIIFFLFVPLALDQLVEWIRHRTLCPDATGPIWQGNDFVVCDAAKLPLKSADQWIHDSYGFMLAIVAYAIVFGAFAANVIDGALRAVPKGQIEAAEAIGLGPRQIRWRIEIPQMWVFALPGLNNLFQILVKATPLLFLLGVEDVVYWARELGGSKTQAFDYPHPDWRAWYFGGLLVFYLAVTLTSQRAFEALELRVARGQIRQ